MTVCTASICQWRYEDGNWGGAIVMAADRMLTDEGLGIEYEASRWKAGVLGKAQLALVAGDMTFHSEVMTNALLRVTGSQFATRQIAEIFAAEVRAARDRRAEGAVLAPLGLSLENYLDRTATSPQLARDIIDELQRFLIDAEAIIAGVDDRVAKLFRVDASGVITDHTDIGFLSIGNGGIHASAQYMFEPYSHIRTYSEALLSTYLAKKRAEVTPGVGAATDMAFVCDEGFGEVATDLRLQLDGAGRQLELAAVQMRRTLASMIGQSGDPPAASETSIGSPPAGTEEGPGVGPRAQGSDTGSSQGVADELDAGSKG